MQETTSPAVTLRAAAFREWMAGLQLARVEAQAEHLGVSRSHLYGVLEGSRVPGGTFIAACVAAGGKFEELFEVAS